jgi:hypothetical protein
VHARNLLWYGVYQRHLRVRDVAGVHCAVAK